MDAREPPRPPPPTLMAGPTSYGPNSSTSSAAAMLSPATARFPFGAVPPPPQQQHQHPPSSEPFPSSASPAVAAYDGSSSPMNACSSLAKKKRGRPRKYSPDGNIALGLAPTHASPPAAADSAGTASADAPTKKHRGRPPGSGKKQLDALGAGGVGFTPHVILVETGEDITAKIMAFSQEGPRTVCILSAIGAIGNVTLRQSALSGSTATYEGRFEIISLSGTSHQSENNCERSRACTLNVTLAGSDGRVLGGGVAGTLTAASTVQIIVGSFIADGKKSSNALKSGPSSSAPQPQMLTFGAPMTPTSPTSQGPSTESSEEQDHTPFCRGPGPGPGGPGHGLYNNAGQPVHNMPMYHHPLWAGQTHQ